MLEAIISLISLAMTIGFGWGVFMVIKSHLTMCEDIAKIKAKLCDKEI